MSCFVAGAYVCQAEELQAALAAAEAHVAALQADNAGLTEARVTALRMLSKERERATRLEALEQAARACYRSEGVMAYRDLLDAVRALDAAGDGG